MKRGSCVVNGREETRCEKQTVGGEGNLKEFKMNYRIYLAPFLLYTVSIGAYRGAMKLSEPCSPQKMVSCGFYIPL